MNASDYQKLKDIFQSAVEIPPDERAAYLDDKCEGDHDLRREVERLLASVDEEFLETPAVEPISGRGPETRSRSGQRIGHYEVIRRIGSGGMGDVYLAVDGKLGRQVAVKILPDEFTADESRLDRFRLEARAASVLSHPNILTIFEVGEWAGTHYIATEYVEGETLRQRLSRERLSIAEAMDLGIQLALAVSAAHEASICHRDIKPENIMIRRDGLLKVVDFGLAKLVASPFRSGSSPTLNDEPTVKIVNTEPGVIMGTVQYMSPEQTRGLPTDERSDIWSLGCVLYEMLTGHAPFVGETSADMVAEIVKSHPELPSRLATDVPERLDEIISKSLEKSPDERYQTAKDLLIDLKRLKRNLELEDTLERSQPRITTDSGDVVISGPNIISTKKGPKDLTEVNSAQYLYWGMKAHRWTTVGITLFVIGLVGGTAMLVRYYWSKEVEVAKSPANPNLTMRYMFELAPKKLLPDSENGVISPDGKLVVYSRIIGDGHTLWTRQVATGKSILIGGPTDRGYYSMRFSSDSQFIFYSIPRAGSPHWELHRISIFGGRPQMLVTNTSEAFSIANDDASIAFVRSDPKTPMCSLYVADRSGKNERVLKTRERPRCYGQIAWSPDRTFIVATVGQSETGDANIEIVKIPSNGGQEVPLTTHKWVAVRSILWHPNGSTLLLTGRKDTNAEFMNVWQIDPQTDSAGMVTDDTNNYQLISLTADGRTMLARRVSLESYLSVGPADEPENAKRVSEAAGRMAWLSSDRVVYGAYKSKTLFTANPDGSQPEEISAHQDSSVATSPDGQYILTMSTENGVHNIWRMNADGTGRVQLTHGSGAQYPIVSPDSKWVYYHSVGNRASAIHKVPIDGGNPVEVVPPLARDPSISPDGKYLAYFGILTDGQRDLFVIELEGGTLKAKFNLPNVESSGRICWSKDVSSIYYAMETSARVPNIWRQSLSGGAPRKLTNFTTDRIFDFSFSPDYSKLALVRGKWSSEMLLVSLTPANAAS